MGTMLALPFRMMPCRTGTQEHFRQRYKAKLRRLQQLGIWKQPVPVMWCGICGLIEDMHLRKHRRVHVLS